MHRPTRNETLADVKRRQKIYIYKTDRWINAQILFFFAIQQNQHHRKQNNNNNSNDVNVSHSSSHRFNIQYWTPVQTEYEINWKTRREKSPLQKIEDANTLVTRCAHLTAIKCLNYSLNSERFLFIGDCCCFCVFANSVHFSSESLTKNSKVVLASRFVHIFFGINVSYQVSFGLCYLCSFFNGLCHFVPVKIRLLSFRLWFPIRFSNIFSEIFSSRLLLL